MRGQLASGTVSKSRSNFLSSREVSLISSSLKKYERQVYCIFHQDKQMSWRDWWKTQLHGEIGSRHSHVFEVTEAYLSRSKILGVSKVTLNPWTSAAMESLKGSSILSTSQHVIKSLTGPCGTIHTTYMTCNLTELQRRSNNSTRMLICAI